MMPPLGRGRLRARHTLLMISAKGGVGKSTLTVNLAAALTARGQRVGIFDADIHGPNIPALLGVRQKRDLVGERNPLAMLPVEARPDALDLRPLAPLERYGIRVMSLALLVGDRQAITPEAKETGRLTNLLLQRVDWGEADVLLLDMPPGTGEPLNTLIDQGLVDAALLIATRERLAHLDNGRLIALLRKRGVPLLGVVENMTHIICPKCGELIELYPQPAAAQEVYTGIEVLAGVPFHPELIRQPGAGAPLPLRAPDSSAAAPLLALAERVMAKLGQTQPTAQQAEADCEDCP
jgi:ATP-binding protein involved in chromosome partitioning